MASKRSISIFSFSERITTENTGLFERKERLNWMVMLKLNGWITAMTKLFNAIVNFTAAAQPLDDNALRRRVRELEAENETLRQKLAWRGPWMF
jgi:hypothetical protein